MCEVCVTLRPAFSSSFYFSNENKRKIQYQYNCKGYLEKIEPITT